MRKVLINTGIYANLIEQFLAHKRSLGHKMESHEHQLHMFDRLTVERRESEIGLTPELVTAWCDLHPGESENSRYVRVGVCRSFALFLQHMGYDAYVPKRPRYRSSFTPYIFTNAEMNEIFHECDKIQIHTLTKFSMRAVTPTLVRLLYSTGLRIGEALKLRNMDVDLENGVLRLYATKNGRDRITPMSQSLIEVCKDYLAFKSKCGLDNNDNDPFFSTVNGLPFTKEAFQSVFKEVLTKACIYNECGECPRIHDLRHTFCVNALLKLSSEGHDLYHSMPILMNYMGHTTLKATNRYVRLTQEMFPELLKKVNSAYACIFPSIFNEDTDK